jgi:glycosyltransferase involved in cell wall biosynthesis
VRIAELSTRYPPGPGGVERHVHEVATRLVGRGHSVTVLTSELYSEFPWRPLDPGVPRRAVEEGVAVERLPAWTLPSELHYPFVRGLPRALAEARPELLHAHTYGTHHTTVARRYHRRTGVPYVLTAHFHPIWSIQGGWARHRLRGFYDRVLAGRTLSEAARVVVQTREEERLLRVVRRELPPVEIIPPGYTPPPAGGLADDAAFATALALPGPFVLFVGRLASNKGLLELVDAFAPLARRDPEVSLVLVGEDGGMRSAIEARVAGHGLADRVRLTGYLTDERLLRAAYREATVFVLPSEYEAFGLVLLEALAQGTAVIASRVGGIPEVLDGGDAGVLVPPNDARSLGEALASLWEDPERRRALGRYGRDHVVPRYSWDRVVDRLEMVFRAVLEER